MQKILLAQAAEGMVLARDVEFPEGRVLCGKGTALTGSLIERLKRMEVSHLTVEGCPVPDPHEKSLEDELREIERRFSRVRRIPPLMYLKKKVVEQTRQTRKAEKDE